MENKPSEILASAFGFEEFRERIISLKGDFSFDAEEMLQLGRVYFLLYPDSSDDRNMENIRMGYRIVRTCIAEKLMDGLDDAHCMAARSLLEETTPLEKSLPELVKNIGIEETESLLFAMEKNLDRVRGVIDELPRGMTKERFVGGISKFYNGMYLINMLLKKMKGPGMPPPPPT